MSPEPFDSRAKAPPAKRSEKGYGDENGLCPVGTYDMCKDKLSFDVVKKSRFIAKLSSKLLLPWLFQASTTALLSSKASTLALNNLSLKAINALSTAVASLAAIFHSGAPAAAKRSPILT